MGDRPSAALFTMLLAVWGFPGCTPTRSGDGSPARKSVVLVPVPVPSLQADPAPDRISATSYAPRPDDELRASLTPLQFEVTQHGATERPFQNAYWDDHEAGIYVDVATGEPLFSSQDKFDSGTGWPSFTRPIEQGRVVEHAATREVKSAGGSSHLGHVFEDGPAPTHRRYCIDSASLRFVPVDRLAGEGYAAYAPLFGPGVARESPAPATSNSCTSPLPGETPGCSTTLDVAIFARTAGDENVGVPGGVLEVARGQEGTRAAVEVTFDPATMTYAEVLAAWTKGREKDSLVYADTPAHRQIAAARGLRVADAEPFRRQ